MFFSILFLFLAAATTHALSPPCWRNGDRATGTTLPQCEIGPMTIVTSDADCCQSFGSIKLGIRTNESTAAPGEPDFFLNTTTSSPRAVGVWTSPSSGRIFHGDVVQHTFPGANAAVVEGRTSVHNFAGLRKFSCELDRALVIAGLGAPTFSPSDCRPMCFPGVPTSECRGTFRICTQFAPTVNAALWGSGVWVAILSTEGGGGGNQAGATILSAGMMTMSYPTETVSVGQRVEPECTRDGEQDPAGSEASTVLGNVGLQANPVSGQIDVVVRGGYFEVCDPECVSLPSQGSYVIAHYPEFK